MKIGGQSIRLRAKHTVTLSGDIGDVSGEDGGTFEMEVEGLPMSFDRTKNRLFPTPALPKRFVKNASGAVLRDPKSKEVLFEEDDSPGPVRDKIELATRNHQLLMVYLGTRHSIEYEAFGPDYRFEDDPERFAKNVEAFNAELEESGFSTGHLFSVQRAVLAATGITEDVMSEARGSFT